MWRRGATRWRRSEPFSAAAIEAALRACAESQGIKAAALIHATRVAVTGQGVSPSLFDVVALVGREATARRLARLQQFLGSVAPLARRSRSGEGG